MRLDSDAISNLAAASLERIMLMVAMACSASAWLSDRLNACQPSVSSAMVSNTVTCLLYSSGKELTRLSISLSAAMESGSFSDLACSRVKAPFMELTSDHLPLL